MDTKCLSTVIIYQCLHFFTKCSCPKYKQIGKGLFYGYCTNCAEISGSNPAFLKVFFFFALPRGSYYLLSGDLNSIMCNQKKLERKPRYAEKLTKMKRKFKLKYSYG